MSLPTTPTSPATPAAAPERLSFWQSWNPRIAAGGAPLAPLAILLAIDATDGLDTAAFAVLLPEIKAGFGLDLASVLTVQAVAAPGAILMGLAAGWLADRFRRSWLIAAGTLVAALSTLLTGLAATVVLLAVARAAAAVGRALAAPARSSLMTDCYPIETRARLFTVSSLFGSIDGWIGGLAAGVLADLAGWRLPFVLAAIPMGAVAMAALRLPSPVRGAPERAHLAAHGVPDATELPEEEPPSLTESWRIAVGVPTLRRIWLALPLLVGAGGGASALLFILAEEQLGLGPAERGVIVFVTQSVGILGLFYGAHVADRLLVYKPGRVMAMLGWLSAATALSYVVLAVVPNVPLFVLFASARSLAAALIAPAMYAIMTLVIPPRARSFALSAGAVFVVPGLVLLPMIGIVGDTYGIRAGVLAVAPIYLIGAAILGSGTTLVAGDLRSAVAASVAMGRAAKARAAGVQELLTVTDLSAGYGGTTVLDGVDLHVEAGEVVALAGSNGAGKSTLLQVVAGVHPPRAGAVLLDGVESSYTPTEERVERGLAYVPGGQTVLPSLTVAEHLRLAARSGAGDAGPDEVLSRFPELARRRTSPGGALSAGEQQLLSIACALVTRPRLLLLDELSMGLAPDVVDRVVDLVAELRGEGLGIVVVAQDPVLAARLADRAVLLERGTVGWEGPADQLGPLQAGRRRPVRPGGSGAVRAPADAGEAVLLARGVAVSHGGVRALDGVDLAVGQGSAVGIVGRNGAGKTTLIDVLAGAIRPDGGQVLHRGRDITGVPAHRRAELGIVRTHSDAVLFPGLTVAEQLRLAGADDERLARLAALLRMEDLLDHPAATLSTGQRRLVNLGLAAAARPEVVLLDEPTAGLSVANVDVVLTAIDLLRRDQGWSLIVVEHDHAAVRALCDEIVVLDLGRVVAAGLIDDVTEHLNVPSTQRGQT